MNTDRVVSKASRLTWHIFVLCMLVCAATMGNAQAATSALANQGPPSLANLADQAKHPVVTIFTTQVVKGKDLQPFSGGRMPFPDFFGDDPLKRFFGDMPQREMKTHALGSGVIIDKEGLILTNNHVVEKATEIKIRLETGKEYEAKVTGRDSMTDLALIQVKPDADFPKPAVMGDSSALRVGDWVMAVGNPYGLGHTVTVGIVSAKGRVIGAGRYDDFLQTDAAINQGNSGGPLFNMAGEIVGINTAIVPQGQNIGFAIPVNMAKEILSQLKSGKVVRGWLGVAIQDVTPDLAKSFGLGSAKGVLVGDIVAGGPAEKAGLKRGDVVLRVDGKDVESARAMSRQVGSTSPGTTIKVDIIREGKEKSVKVKIATLAQKEEQPPSEEEATWGIAVQDITPDLAHRLGLGPDETGVIISDVDPDSAAAEAGLRPGDLIVQVNREDIEDLDDYNEAMEKAAESQTVLLLVKREKGTFFVILRHQQPHEQEQ